MTEEKRTLETLIREIGKWNRETFPGSTVKSKAEHLRREAIELAETPGDESEMADIFILWAGIVDLLGVDYVRAIEKKMAKNYKRKWKAPDEHGVIEHLEEGEDDAPPSPPLKTPIPGALDKVNSHRLVLYVKNMVIDCLAPFAYEPNDSKTWADMTTRVEKFLYSLMTQHLLSDFRVICNEHTTTKEMQARGEMGLHLYYRQRPTLEFIGLHFVLRPNDTEEPVQTQQEDVVINPNPRYDGEEVGP